MFGFGGFTPCRRGIAALPGPLTGCSAPGVTERLPYTDTGFGYNVTHRTGVFLPVRVYLLRIILMQPFQLGDQLRVVGVNAGSCLLLII